MAEISLPPRAALVVIPGIELAAVGEHWPMRSDGKEEGTITPEDLAAAVDAQSDPAVRSPILKMGHVRAGQPAFGRLQNLRTTSDGMTLLGDLVGAPAWLADVLPYAWPSRSIEGSRNETTETGRTHLLRIDALALLGVELPAISTLDEVEAVYTAASMEEANVTLSASVAAAHKEHDMGKLAAGTTTEDIRRAYYDDQPANTWAWIREIELDPLTLIVDDDDGGLWRVPVTVAGDAVTFGAAVAVHVEYVPLAAGAATSANRTGGKAIVYASRAESLEGVALDPKELRKSMGLAETATDAEVLARAAELAARPEVEPAGDPITTPSTGPVRPAPSVGTVPAVAPVAPTTEPAPIIAPVVDDNGDSTRISTAVLEQLQADAALGVAASRRQALDDENAFIGRHRARLGPSSNPKAGRLEASWRREWQRNPGEAEALAASHAVIMPTGPIGHDDGAELVGEDAVYAALFGTESKD